MMSEKRTLKERKWERTLARRVLSLSASSKRGDSKISRQRLNIFSTLEDNAYEPKRTLFEYLLRSDPKLRRKKTDKIMRVAKRL